MTSGWTKVGIELPPGWKDVIAERAAALKCPMRCLWVAAIDRLLALPREELEQMVLAYEMLGRRELDKLSATRPGECGPLLENWTRGIVRRIDPNAGRSDSLN